MSCRARRPPARHAGSTCSLLRAVAARAETPPPPLAYAVSASVSAARAAIAVVVFNLLLYTRAAAVRAAARRLPLRADYCGCIAATVELRRGSVWRGGERAPASGARAASGVVSARSEQQLVSWKAAEALVAGRLWRRRTARGSERSACAEEVVVRGAGAFSMARRRLARG